MGGTQEVENPAPPQRDNCMAPAGLIRPCLLLLLGEACGHGYELLERLRSQLGDLSNPGRVYRALHSLEAANLVRSRWDTAGSGPARRVYELTSQGRHALDASAADLHHLVDVLGDYLVRYRHLKRSTSTDEQAFEVLVETTVSVDAPDEALARKKVQDVLARARRLKDDVWFKGPTWVYQAEQAED